MPIGNSYLSRFAWGLRKNWTGLTSGTVNIWTEAG